MVTEALRGEIADMHGISVRTMTPAEYEKEVAERAERVGAGGGVPR